MYREIFGTAHSGSQYNLNFLWSNVCISTWGCSRCHYLMRISGFDCHNHFRSNVCISTWGCSRCHYLMRISGCDCHNHFRSNVCISTWGCSRCHYLMRISGCDCHNIFRWENLQNRQCIKYLFSSLYQRLLKNRS
ncbi:uncharacterized protein ACNLHF_021207 isoform 1-T1 [Anomaloglossus baeobatrachus]